jgi:hypothetical protein
MSDIGGEDAEGPVFGSAEDPEVPYVLSSVENSAYAAESSRS